MVNLVVVHSVLEWFCFVFVGITLPIYIFFIGVLIVYRNTRELKGAFFKLCISLGFCDILSMFNNYIGYRFPYWGWGTNFYLNGGPSLAKIFILISWGLRMVQGVGVTLLAINRATAVIWPYKYLKVWSTRVLSAAIAFQVFMGILFSLPLAFQNYYWDIGNKSSLIITFKDAAFKNQYFVVAFIVQTILVSIITIAYGSMFVSFHRKNKVVSAQDISGSNKQSQELKLAAMGSIVCLFEILWFVFVLYTSIISPLSTDTFFLFYDTLTDIYSGISPYLMFTFSSAVRDRIKRIFRPHRSSSVTILPTRAFSVALSPRSQSPAMYPVDHNVIVVAHY